MGKKDSRAPQSDSRTSESASASTESAAGGAQPPEARVRGPRVFHGYGALILVGPFLIYTIGMGLGSYLDAIFLQAKLNHEIHPVVGQLSLIDQDLINRMENGVGDEGRSARARRNFLKIDELVKVLADHEADSIDLQNAASRFYENKDWLQQPQYIVFRKRLDNYLEKLKYVEDKGKRKRRNHEDDALVVNTSEGESSSEAETPTTPSEDDGLSFLNDDDLTTTPPIDPELAEELDAGVESVDVRTCYPIAYTISIGATVLAMLCVSWGYVYIPFRINFLSVIVGVVGIVAWVGLWYADKHWLHLGELVSQYAGRREAFNPLEELKDNPTWMWTFMAIRFAGLVLIVPIVEEFFLRGFLMRYIDSVDWDELPIGHYTWMSVVGIAIYGVVSHPAEWLAAVVWFSLITWLFIKTKSIWDCVVAHAVTNLLLGLFILKTGFWELW
ncbi:MAG: CAAX prenyl protease-related protein [Pirellulaceae bacterium]|nr:CAAX prenyl protease-related protein [Planctomycetales bacterium]